MTKTTVLFALLAVSACVPRVSVMTYDKDTHIKVFRAPHLPECGYEEIGEVKWREDMKRDNTNEARALAFEKGAMMMVIHDNYDASAVTGGVGMVAVTSGVVVRTAQLGRWTNLRCQN